jgi:hypothetical protein
VEVIPIKVALHFVILAKFLGILQGFSMERALPHIQPVLFRVVRLALLKQELAITAYGVEVISINFVLFLQVAIALFLGVEQLLADKVLPHI